MAASTASSANSDLLTDPVMHSSGNTANRAPACLARRSHLSTRSRLAAGSPIAQCIATAATRTVSASAGGRRGAAGAVTAPIPLILPFRPLATDHRLYSPIGRRV